MIFKEYLQDLMTQKGVGVNELSRQSGVSGTLISRILKGDRPATAKTILKLAPALQVSTDEMMVAAGYITPMRLQPIPTYPAETLKKIEADLLNDPEFAVIATAWKEGSKELQSALALIVQMHKFKNKPENGEK